MRRLSAEEVTDRIQQTLTALIRTQAESLDPEVPAILAGHVTVNDAVTSSEQSMMLGTDHVLLRSAVALDCFEYVALGHIHRHQILGRSPHVVYSGSLQRIDFGEERDDKGLLPGRSRPLGPARRAHGQFRVQARQSQAIPHHQRQAPTRRPRPRTSRSLTRSSATTCRTQSSGLTSSSHPVSSRYFPTHESAPRCPTPTTSPTFRAISPSRLGQGLTAPPPTDSPPPSFSTDTSNRGRLPRAAPKSF